MADLQKTIEIIFQGRDKTATALKAVGRNINSVSGQVESWAQPFATMADGVLKVDAALTAMAGAGLVYAYNKSREFGAAVVDLEKVLTDTSGMDEAKRSAIDLSNKYGVAAKDILASIAGFKQAGYDLTESIGLTVNALDQVIAGEVSAADSSELLIAQLKGFDAPASKAGGLLDMMNSVSTEYATNVEQLSHGMAGLSPVAKAMGLSMEETAGVLTPVIEVFRSGDQAAIAMKTALLKLVDDAKPVQGALQSLGVSQRDANGQMRSGRDILWDVMQAYTGLDESQKAYVTQQLVGIEQSARALTVFDNLAKVQGVTATAYNKTYTAVDEVNKKLASSDAIVQQAGTVFENLAVIVGGKIEQAGTSAVSGWKDVLLALQEVFEAEGGNPLLDMVNDLAGDVGEALSNIAEHLPQALEQVDYSGLTDALGDLGEQVTAFFDMDVSSPEGLAQAIQMVIDVLTTLTHVTSGMAQAFEPYLTGLADMAAGSGNLSEETAKDFGEIIGNAKAIVTMGAEIAGAFLVAQKAGVNFGDVLTVAINGVGLAVDGIQESFLLFEQFFVGAVSDLLTISKTIDDWTPFHPFRQDIEAAQIAVKAWGDTIESDLAENQKQVEQELSAIGKAFNDVPDEKNITTNIDNKQAKKDLADTKAAIDDVPEKKASVVNVDNRQGLAAIRDYDRVLEQTADHKETTVTANTKQAEDRVADFGRTVDDYLHDQHIEVTVNDDGSIEIISKNLASLPDKKSVDVGVTGEDALKQKLAAMEQATELTKTRIKESSDIIQTRLEWSAKLDIAQVEAASEQVVAIAKGLGDAWESSGDVMSSAFGSLADLAGSSRFSDVMDLAEQEMRIRDELLEMQKKEIETQGQLMTAQIDYMQAKSESLRSGDAMITINGDGLQPHLENIMWEIFSAIQIRVNEEGLDALVGVGS